MYVTAFFFRHYILEDHIVVRYLLPRMDTSEAMFALREISKRLNNDKERPSRLLLADFAAFKVSKSLPKLLVSERARVEELDQQSLSKVIQRSLTSLKGNAHSDLDAIVKFAAKTFGQTNVFLHLMAVCRRYKKCMCFDHQSIK